MIPASQEDDPAANKRRIRRTSRRLQHLCTLIVVAVPVAAILFWSTASVGTGLLPSFVKDMPIVLTPVTRVAAILCTMIPGAVLIWAFLTLRRLFGLYAADQIFSPANVRCFRHLGLASLLWTVANLAYSASLSVVLTLGNPPGQRFLAISASGVDLTALFAGIVLLVISWVMDEARHLDEDRSQIV